MRKFAMTLVLGLGMATASFAGNVETTNTAEKAEAPKAPKRCVTYDAGCGERVLCSDTDAGIIAVIVDAIEECQKFGV